MPEPPQTTNRQLLLKYAGLASQMLVTLGVTVWLGWFIDRKLISGKPVLIIALPLLVLVGTLLKIYRDTSKKNK